MFLNIVEVGGIQHVAVKCIYAVEHQLRRQLTKLLLTLRHESVGSEQD